MSKSIHVFPPKKKGFVPSLRFNDYERNNPLPIKCMNKLVVQKIKCFINMAKIEEIALHYMNQKSAC